MEWLYKKECHMTRFFGTKWNSKISLKRWHKNDLKKRGVYFYNGYVEICFDKWALRYRNNKGRLS
jgi:hypothetical protein